MEPFLNNDLPGKLDLTDELMADIGWTLLDTDDDGIPDTNDNCTLVANGPNDVVPPEPSQNDTDMDGYGNRCDADLNNDGLVTVSDFLVMRNVLNTNNADADLNGDGAVTVTDFLILRNNLNRPPGPSGEAP